MRYVLTGEGAASIFSIDESTGDIHATRRLDREQQAYYTLRAQARDRHTDRLLEPESQFVIKVQDVNDNEPKFLEGPYTARVAERSPVGESPSIWDGGGGGRHSWEEPLSNGWWWWCVAGTLVVAVVATDADDPTYGNSARLTYSILQGQPYFSVEPKTGGATTTPTWWGAVGGRGLWGLWGVVFELNRAWPVEVWAWPGVAVHMCLHPKVW